MCSSRVALLALSLVASLVAAPARAGGCNPTCRVDVALCVRTQCEGVGNAACRRRCKPAPVRTLAYVLNDCQVDAAGGFVGHQALRIRRGDREPVTVAEFSSSPGVSDPLELCRRYGEGRFGYSSIVVGVFQRLGVSPDGSRVVFEVTDDLSFFAFTEVPPEAEGMFVVHADGSGLQRLGAASRDPSFRIVPAATPVGFDVSVTNTIAFSPDGRRVAFTDLGPGPTGEETAQIWVLDLATGRRTQVTPLSPASSPSPTFPVTCCPFFEDDETILFQTFADPSGSAPDGTLRAFRVRIDGTGLRALSTPIAVPGSQVVPTFRTTGLATGIVALTLPGEPVNPSPGFLTTIQEVFFVDGKNLLQLTRFGRIDTLSQFLSVDRRRAFFQSSADPFGANPFHNCQLFSVGTFGTGLRQVTRFVVAGPVEGGCFGGFPPGCGLGGAIQDPVTRAIVFDASCDPLATNPYGWQTFAMRPDGSGLRQLTRARGRTTAPDGTITVELPGPFAYSSRGGL